MSIRHTANRAATPAPGPRSPRRPGDQAGQNGTYLMARRATPTRPRDDGSVTDDRHGSANRSYHGPASVRHRVWAYLAAAWAIIFAAPHVYWATGHTAGLGTGLSNSNGTAITNMSWALQLGCVGVAVFCLCGAGAALATLRSWTPRWRPLVRRVLLGLAWLGEAHMLRCLGPVHTATEKQAQLTIG